MLFFPKRIFVGLCRETWGYFLTPICDLISEILMATVENNVVDGSVIYADCLRRYAGCW